MKLPGSGCSDPPGQRVLGKRRCRGNPRVRESLGWASLLHGASRGAEQRRRPRAPPAARSGAPAASAGMRPRAGPERRPAGRCGTPRGSRAGPSGGSRPAGLSQQRGPAPRRAAPPRGRGRGRGGSAGPAARGPLPAGQPPRRARARAPARAM